MFLVALRSEHLIPNTYEIEILNIKKKKDTLLLPHRMGQMLMMRSKHADKI